MNDLNRALYLSNLENCLGGRFERSSLMEDIDRVLEKMGHSVDSTAVDHPYHSTFLNNLGLHFGIDLPAEGRDQ